MGVKVTVVNTSDEGEEVRLFPIGKVLSAGESVTIQIAETTTVAWPRLRFESDFEQREGPAIEVRVHTVETIPTGEDGPASE